MKKWWLRSKGVLGGVITAAASAAALAWPEEPWIKFAIGIGAGLGIIGVRAKQERDSAAAAASLSLAAKKRREANQS